MTHKTQNTKTIWHFLHKKFGKIFWIVFKNFQLKYLDFGQKNGWFDKILELKNKTKQKQTNKTKQNKKRNKTKTTKNKNKTEKKIGQNGKHIGGSRP